MKRILLALLLLISLNGFSQSSWVEQGAVWHYGYWYVGGAGVRIFNYDTDTIIQGNTCQKITSVEYRFQQVLPPPAPLTVTGPYTLINRYTYNSQDTVFYLHQGIFYPMYIFSAQPGDSWNVKSELDTATNCPYVNVKVSSIGDTIISGQILRWLKIDRGDSSAAAFSNGTGSETVTVIEKIGITGPGFLFPYSYPYCLPEGIIFDPEYHTFRCFSSPTISLYVYNDCDDLASLPEIKSSAIQFSIFPNPSQGVTNINPANSAYSYNISVYDIAGRQLQTLSGIKGNYQLDTEALPKGVYAIRIDQAGKLYYHKLIIN
jgi:hypothetical protein